MEIYDRSDFMSLALMGCAKLINPSSPAAKCSNGDDYPLPTNIDPADEYNGWFTVRYGVGETLKWMIS